MIRGCLGRKRCEEEINRGPGNEYVHAVYSGDGLKHMPKFIKLCTLKVYKLLYVNYTSIQAV